MKLSHRQLGKAAASMALATFCTFLAASAARADNYRIGFSNGCHSTTIKVAVSWLDPDSGEWIDNGWYEFSAGERAILNGPRTDNRIFYYYAESADGSKIWGADDQPELVVGGRSYSPRKAVADPSNGSYYVNLTCRGETPIETTSEVVVERYDDIGGGWGGAKATLYRSGLLVIEGRAVSNSNTSGTRATVNVVGLDRNGNVLFVSQHLDIPTACGRWDTCSSDRRGRSDQNISPEIAKFVNRLQIHISDRGGPSIYSRITRNIREACQSYDGLPSTARAAIASQTGFPGCQ